MKPDRDAIKKAALAAIDSASDAELRRCEQDVVYAENWLQKAIGFIAGLITIVTAIFALG